MGSSEREEFSVVGRIEGAENESLMLSLPLAPAVRTNE